jgi:hypothetical protein
MSRAEKLCGVSSLVLLGSMLFLTWFSLAPAGSTSSAGVGLGRNAFQAFTWIDLVLFAAAAAGIGLVVLMLRHVDRGLPIARAVLLLGALSFVLVAIRIIDPPDLLLATVSLPNGAQEIHASNFGGMNVTSEPGAWLGLLGAAGLTVAGYLAIGERTPAPTTVATAAPMVGTALVLWQPPEAALLPLMGRAD